MTKSWLIVAAIASAFVTFASACSDDTKPDSDGTIQGQDTTLGDGSPDGSNDKCAILTSNDLEAVVFDYQDDVSISYSFKVKPNLGVPLQDYFVLQFINQASRIDNTTGTFPLDDIENGNFGTCAECLALWLDQPDISKPPGKILFQSAGTIRLDVDPRLRKLKAHIEGLTFQEIAIDQETLESTFVADGACARLSASIDIDFKWIPPEWKCGDATYFADDGCDCDCGNIDPDCYPTWDTPAEVASSDCDAGSTCYYGDCRVTCSNFAPTKGCGATEVCIPEMPDDLCVPKADKVDAAALGETCTGVNPYVCGVGEGANPTGICSYDDARSCRPLCRSRADCAADEYCYTIAVNPQDLTGKGYCMDGLPPGWLCDQAKYLDGVSCECGCGEYDRDCDNAALPVAGCESGQTCSARGECQ